MTKLVENNTEKPVWQYQLVNEKHWNTSAWPIWDDQTFEDFDRMIKQLLGPETKTRKISA